MGKTLMELLSQCGEEAKKQWGVKGIVGTLTIQNSPIRRGWSARIDFCATKVNSECENYGEIGSDIFDNPIEAMLQLISKIQSWVLPAEPKGESDGKETM